MAQTQKPKIYHRSGGSNEWSTPDYLFRYLSTKYGPFDLDAAASDSNHLCNRYFTEKDSALTQDWNATNIFCNPPYSPHNLQAAFIKKAYSQYRNFSRCVLLIPARVDTEMWHDYIHRIADEIIFIKGRLNFGFCKDPAGFPSAIVVYYGGPLRYGTLERPFEGTKYSTLNHRLLGGYERYMEKCVK